jgi:hypothetical protein
MEMPGRKWTASNYRYSHNGQEKETEIFSGANSAEFWMYDSRIGRRWELDPIQREYESPYACFSNNPIYFSDLLGLAPGGGDKGKNKSSGKGGSDLKKDNEWKVKQPQNSNPKSVPIEETKSTIYLPRIETKLPQDNTIVKEPVGIPPKNESGDNVSYPTGKELNIQVMDLEPRAARIEWSNYIKDGLIWSEPLEVNDKWRNQEYMRYAHFGTKIKFGASGGLFKDSPISLDHSGSLNVGIGLFGVGKNSGDLVFVDWNGYAEDFAAIVKTNSGDGGIKAVTTYTQIYRFVYKTNRVVIQGNQQLQVFRYNYLGAGQPLINGTKIKDTSTYDFATPAFHYGSFQVGVNH